MTDYRQSYPSRRAELEGSFSSSLEGKRVVVPRSTTMVLAPGSYMPLTPLTALTFTDGIGQNWNLTNDGSPFSLITPTTFANANANLDATFLYFPHVSERGVLLWGDNVNPDGAGNFTLRNILPGYWSVVGINGASTHVLQIDQGRTPITLILAAADVPAGTVACAMRLRALL